MTRAPAQRLKVLLSAYACEPGRGSEPAVGWHLAAEIARRHEAWVITRSNNRDSIEAELARMPLPRPRFVYVDLPAWARFWKRGRRGLALYYYLWQLLAYRVARALHREVDFDLVHHVTFVKYSVPSLLVRLPVPFVWGPVGGGELTPGPFRRDFGWRGRLEEAARDLARWVGEHDPLVRATARRCAVALAATEETASRLRGLGASDVRLCSQVGASRAEIEALQAKSRESMPFRLVSVGRLLDWKGFHLGLRAFARARIANAEYWIIGDGPARRRLQNLARDLDVGESVRFLGELPREEVLESLRNCHALVHPALHESGGWVCWEAMAAGCPVICLDLGGPALQVNEATGFRIAATAPTPAVADLADAMAKLARDPWLWQRQSRAARETVPKTLRWDGKCEWISALYRDVLEAQRGPEPS